MIRIEQVPLKIASSIFEVYTVHQKNGSTLPATK